MPLVLMLWMQQYNVAVGSSALDANTTASHNTAVGTSALTANTTGSENTAMGSSALAAVTTGNYNVAIGDEAGAALVSGTENTFMGFLSGRYTGSADHPDYNAGFGARSLYANTTGEKSVAMGAYALSGQTTGGNNTGIGYAAGDAITTGSTNICIGNYTDPSANNSSGQIAIGYNVTCTANATVTIGYGSDTASLSLDGSDTSWAATSDIRLKDNVEDSLAGLDFINELRPITYKWKAKKDVPSDMPEYDDGSDEPCKGTGKTNHGFVAQEVKAVIDKYDSVKDGHNIWQEEDSGTQTLAPSALMPMMVKAVQELSAEVEELKKQLENK